MIAKARQVVLERAEREIMQSLARAFAEQAPAVTMTVGVKRDAGALAADVEAERLIEGLRLLEIRHRHAEMVERMHAQHAGPARRLDEPTDLRHRFLLEIPLVPATRLRTRLRRVKSQ